MSWCLKIVMSAILFSGGESAWGEAFKDEFKPNLIHQGKIETYSLTSMDFVV